jgi:hypothetical protein
VSDQPTWIVDDQPEGTVIHFGRDIWLGWDDIPDANLAGVVLRHHAHAALVADVQAARRVDDMRERAEAADEERDRALDALADSQQAACRLPEVETRLAAALGFMSTLIDREPCRLDHNDYCQTHYSGQPCIHAAGADFLDALAAKKEEGQ